MDSESLQSMQQLRQRVTSLEAKVAVLEQIVEEMAKPKRKKK